MSRAAPGRPKPTVAPSGGRARYGAHGELT
jgi:hypothetical protein